MSLIQKVNQANWSEIQPDLLDAIAKKLTIYEDYVRLRAVCVKWRSALSPKPHHLPTQLPWIMLPFKPNNETRCGFFDLWKRKIHHFEVPITCPPRRCCGSSHGWLVFVETSPIILLFNPLTKIEIQLPPITTLPNVLDFNVHNVDKEYILKDLVSGVCFMRSLKYMRNWFIKKIILSASPTSPSEDYIAVAIGKEEYWSEGFLAFCKKGDEAWTIINSGGRFNYQNVIYYKGLFYGVDEKGSLAVCDVNGPTITVIKPPRPVSDSHYYSVPFLVDKLGELLLVIQYYESPDYTEDVEFSVNYTVKFEVFRLDSSTPKWVEVNTLGDCMLFLGTNSSLCFLATDFSECEGNHIYFTGEYVEPIRSGSYGNHDSGVFNLCNGTIKKLPYCSGSQMFLSPPPIWLTPNP